MSDFLIVGGGVIGLSLAWELARRGGQVRVLEGGHYAKASWVGAGILPPPLTLASHDPVEQLRCHSHRLHVEWSQRLLAETGIDNELDTCGGIYVATSAAEAASLHVNMDQMRLDGVRVEPLDVTALGCLEPSLLPVTGKIEAAYLLSDEMQLHSPRYLDALTLACRQLGVEMEMREVTGLRSVGGRVSVMSGESESTAEQICLCAGARTPELLAKLGHHLPVEPWRGQLVIWECARPPLKRVLNEGHRYLVPRRDGHLLAGATVEDVGFTEAVTKQALDSLKEFSLVWLPQLGQQTVKRVWAGLRAGSPDGRPYLGRVPGYDNLSVATGHYRSGLHLSTGTAVCMAQLLLDDTCDVDLSPFRLNR